MAQPDTQAYSNAMFGLRKAQENARYPDVRPWVRGYYDCAQLPLGPLVVDVDARVLDRVAFPKEYFLWAQSYVREAIAHKPPARASAEARVFWMLDVWATMVQGLLALNSPMEYLGYAPGNAGLTIPKKIVDKKIVSGLGGALGPFQKAYEEVSQLLGDKKRAMKPAERLAAEQWNASVLAPPAFFDLPFAWASANREVQRRLYKLLPWTIGGMATLGPSRIEVDLEYVWQRASEQWSLWNIQDGVQRKFGKYRQRWVPGWKPSRIYTDWWPLHMGKRTSMPGLAEYIDAVARYESVTPELSWDAPLLYPNFAWSYRYMNVMLNAFVALDYEAVVSDAVADWIVAAAPRKNEPKPGKFIPMPLSCEDYHDVTHNNLKAMKQRAANAAAAPLIGVNNTLKDVQKALKDIQKAVMAAEKAVAVASVAAPALAEAGVLLGTVAGTAATTLPIVGLIIAAQALVMYLVLKYFPKGWLAVGYAADPDSVPRFYVQPNPFLRTIVQRGYDAIASRGSTAEAFFRTLDAIKNIEIVTKIDMGFYAGAWQPAKPLRVMKTVLDQSIKYIPKDLTGGTLAPILPTEADCRLFVIARLVLDGVDAVPPNEIEALVQSCKLEGIQKKLPPGTTEALYQRVRFFHTGPEMLVVAKPSAAKLIAAGGAGGLAALWFLL